MPKIELYIEEIGYALYVVEKASQLIDAILDHKPIAEICRELIPDLQHFYDVAADDPGNQADEIIARITEIDRVEVQHQKIYLFYPEPKPE